jgi:hypothetical protein
MVVWQAGGSVGYRYSPVCIDASTYWIMPLQGSDVKKLNKMGKNLVLPRNENSLAVRYKS